MNEQQLQQILTIQQAIAAAATAAVINSLLNPQQQQAAGLNTANALIDPSNDLQQQQQQQQAQQDSRQSPTNASSPTTVAVNSLESNSRIQDFLLQLQQQAAVSGGASPLNLNLNTSQAAQAALSGLTGSPISRSPVNNNNNRLTTNITQELNATTSNTTNLHQQLSNQASPIKKLKRHHHQQQQQQLQPQLFHNRSSEATSKPQHSTPKNHSTISNLSRNNNQSSNTTSSSSPSAFISNNVGLPRKLVRGQDVWLGRGAEQTRQILKCMWCGQSFRTLAEMTQHMKITQHYTNIISQEQITSWRQPESSDTVSSKHGKQSNTQLRSLEDNHDDLSDKFNDSDRDDTFSNDDDLEQQSKHQLSSQPSRLDQQNKNNDSIDNNSITGSNHGDSPSTSLKNLASSKPVTRSRKRENETSPIKRDPFCKVNSPTTSSSSQQRQSSSSSSGSVNLILGDLNEDSETNKSSTESHMNGNPQKPSEIPSKVTSNKRVKEEGKEKEEKEEEEETERGEAGGREGEDDDVDDDNDNDDDNDDDDDDNDDDDDDDNKNNEKIEQDLDGDDDNLKRDENHKPNGDSSVRLENEKLKKMTNEEDDTVGDRDRDEPENEDEERSETNESAETTSSNAKACVVQKGETGDPLSALETMVEKSFDPRLRPGVANGGILQRLGIDEEVCPPWQHINYANWYAAAAYGHPMAAALLAAGINLQNGIKLSKNVDSKKNED